MRSGGLWFAFVAHLSIVLAGVPLVLDFGTLAVHAQAIPVEVQQGYGLLGKGWVKDAIATFQRAVQRYPQSVEARLGLAIAYRRNGQDGEAFRAYEQVLALDPNNQLALRSLGLLGGYRPEWQARGIEALTTLLNLNPNDGEARAQRALLYGYQGRFAESLADYQIALQGNPSPDVLLGAAQVYTYNGNDQQGLELFNRYQRTGGKIQGFAAIAYARALRNTGNAAQAIEVLQTQLTRPNRSTDLDSELRAELSLAYLANQQQAQALAALDPLRDRPAATLPLARGLNEIGRQLNLPALTIEAANLYQRVLAQTPNPSPALLQEAADVLSGQPQNREEALQLYRRVAQTQPEDRALQVKILALESQLGTLSKAELRQKLQPLLNPLPADPFQQQAIAQALVRVDPDPEFLPIYQTLLQSGAGQTEPFLNFRVAQILVERNDLVGARNALAAYTATPQAKGDLAPQLLAAEIERREGNLTASARRYEAILAASPANNDVQLAAIRGLAGVRLAQGRTSDALQLYDQLVARNPTDARLQLGRASIAYQAKQISTPEAEAVLNNWLNSRPASDTPLELFSLVGALPPDPQRESLYLTLTEADPNYLPVQLRLVQVVAKRNPAEAKALARQLIARSRATGTNDTSTYLLQGQLAQAAGDISLADQAFQSVLQQQPDNVDALIGLGDIRFQQRQWGTARQLYSEALALKPGDVGIQRSLIEVEVAQDYPLTALQKLEELQLQQGASTPDSELAQRQQKIEEDFLQRRGFQPPWERY